MARHPSQRAGVCLLRAAQRSYKRRHVLARISVISKNWSREARPESDHQTNLRPTATQHSPHQEEWAKEWARRRLAWWRRSPMPRTSSVRTPSSASSRATPARSPSLARPPPPKRNVQRWNFWPLLIDRGRRARRPAERTKRAILAWSLSRTRRLTPHSARLSLRSRGQDPLRADPGERASPSGDKSHQPSPDRPRAPPARPPGASTATTQTPHPSAPRHRASCGLSSSSACSGSPAFASSSRTRPTPSPTTTAVGLSTMVCTTRI